MRFSIIVPVYNAEKYLDACLHSVLDQDYQDYEILLINDGSTDGSEALCAEYASDYTQVRFCSQSNAGPSAARNRGIQMAEGEYLMFLDSDDMILPESLKKLEEVLIQDHPDAVISSLIFRNNDVLVPENTVTDQLWKDNHGNRILDEICRSRYSTPASKVIIRRQLIVQSNILFPTEYKIGEDIFMMSQALCSSASMVYNPEPYYVYNQNDASITHNVNYDVISKTMNICNEMYVRSENMDESRRKFQHTQMSMMLINFLQHYRFFVKEQRAEVRQWLKAHRKMLQEVADTHYITSLASKFMGPGNAFLLAGLIVGIRKG